MHAADSSGAGAPRAGWWVRFFPYPVDNLIVGIPAFIVGFIVAAMAGWHDKLAGTYVVKTA
jgi:uncharacterized RDD family membrane protein YckC